MHLYYRYTFTILEVNPLFLCCEAWITQVEELLKRHFDSLFFQMKSRLNFERSDRQWGKSLESTVGDGEFPTSTPLAFTQSFVRNVIERYLAGELESSIRLLNRKISHNFV
ncbi:hypothetical protein NPIL_547211 [Nephila pilipes]|uniref:Uncharacterized protein n=1 Tax=Nephila pilipes TaxID=299642 RepID=A0A8X6IM81_NEPPI|nr:hypothetical protein NPIL_547211 [Nephila pilipes]